LVAVSPTSLISEVPGVERRSIRFFTPIGDIEPPVCGHGTLAASKAIFDLPEVRAAGTNVVHFETSFGKRLEATKLEDGWIEIEIPATTPGDVGDDDKRRLKGHVDRAFGRDVRIKDIKTGGSVYKTCEF
jgi:predicted PhzF superfamily epimerase YddE/YHI9